MYQDEHDYQQQIDQQPNAGTETEGRLNTDCPLSARDVTAIRQNIIDKLNKRKAVRAHKRNTLPSLPDSILTPN